MRADPAHRFLFYASDLERSSQRAALTGDEHHHVSRVLRMNAGATLYVTNGRGMIARCVIEETSGHATRVAVNGVEEDNPAPRPVTLALALLRKDAFAQAVDQCTELGITRCIPFVSEKSHIETYSPVFIERLRRVALSAMKQSFRSVLPDIVTVTPFDALLERAKEAAVILVGDSAGASARESRRDESLMIVVGPEGGFTESERGALHRAGARPVSVSRFRLRSETAAASLVALALSA